MMKTFVLILIVLSMWLRLAKGHIQDGVVVFDPVPNAVRYTLWSVLPGQTAFRLTAISETNQFVPGPLIGGTTLYVRSIVPDSAGTFVESDLGHVVTPPELVGTNVIRLIQLNRIIQGADTAAGPWQDLAKVTTPPVTLSLPKIQFIRLKMPTNSPPMPGGAP